MSLFQDVFGAFFPGKEKSTTPKSSQPSTPKETQETLTFGPLPRSGKLSQTVHNRALYGKSPSFIDHLPWAEFIEQDGVMLFDDGQSAGAVFDIKPIGTEGRS